MLVASVFPIYISNFSFSFNFSLENYFVFDNSSYNSEELDFKFNPFL